MDKNIGQAVEALIEKNAGGLQSTLRALTKLRGLKAAGTASAQQLARLAGLEAKAAGRVGRSGMSALKGVSSPSQVGQAFGGRVAGGLGTTNAARAASHKAGLISNLGSGNKRAFEIQEGLRKGTASKLKFAKGSQVGGSYSVSANVRPIGDRGFLRNKFGIGAPETVGSKLRTMEALSAQQAAQARAKQQASSMLGGAERMSAGGMPPRGPVPPTPKPQPKAPVQTPPVTPTPTPTVQPQAPPVQTLVPDPTLGRTVGAQAEQLASNVQRPGFWQRTRLNPVNWGAEGAHQRQLHGQAKAFAKTQVVNRRALESAGQMQTARTADKAWVEQMRGTGMSDDAIRVKLQQRGGGQHQLGNPGSYADEVMGIPGAKTPAKVPGGGDKVVRDSTGKIVSEGGGGSLGQTPVGESAKKLSQMSPAQYMEWIKANPGKAALGGLGVVGGMHVAGNVLGGGSRRRGGGAIATY